MTTQQENDYKIICQVIDNTRLVADRIKELENLGYLILEFSMGAGGVKQVKELKNETRIQISHGRGKHNYAYAVRLIKDN